MFTGFFNSIFQYNFSFFSPNPILQGPCVSKPQGGLMKANVAFADVEEGLVGSFSTVNTLQADVPT